MDVVSIGPLCAASLIWRHARGSWAQTVICKATFNLAPDESPLAGRRGSWHRVDVRS
ncbi:MAG TPA: hypothetical protein VE093_17295 [Polyangiaceae bacterium]|nr:hypothetical protein [Polyangiaceae bacterium]